MAFNKSHNRPMPGKPGGLAAMIAPGKGEEKPPVEQPPEEKPVAGKPPLGGAPAFGGAPKPEVPPRPELPPQQGQPPAPEPQSEELQSIADELGLPIEDVREVAIRVFDVVFAKLGL